MRALLFVKFKKKKNAVIPPPPTYKCLKRTFKFNMVSCHQFLIAELGASENWTVEQITYSTLLFSPPLALNLCWQGDLTLALCPQKKMWLYLHLLPFSLLLPKCRNLCCNKPTEMKTDIIECLFSWKGGITTGIEDENKWHVTKPNEQITKHLISLSSSINLFHLLRSPQV